MISQKNKAFTLVELIVVIVILAILATIAFLSFNSYSSSARDSTRLSDIINIAKGLTLQYTVGGYYILPDNAVNLYSGSTLIGYQGKAGSNTLNFVKISNNGGRDPIDNTYYTYNTNINKNRYQVTGYLENKGTIINRTSYIDYSSVILNLIQNLSNLTQYDNGSFLINQTNATNYINRYPYTKGDSIGVILNYTGTTSNPIYAPLEDSGTGIDISSGTLTSGKVVISNNSDSSTGVSIVSMSGYNTTNTSSSNNGTCGTTNGTIVSSTPTNNLCILGATGAVSYSTGMGQYTWTCGGTSCKANDNYNVLLLHFDGNYGNSGTVNPIINNNGGVVFDTNGKFGSGVSFNGTSQYLRLNSSSNYNVGGNDFTIDGRFRVNNISDPFQGIFGGGDLNWVSFLYHGSITKNYLWLGNGGWIGTCNGVTGIKTNWVSNQWYHFAFVKSGTLHNIYIDGTLDISCNSATQISEIGNLVIGTSNNNSYLLKGAIDEFRFSKGIARWTTNFTPPNSPY